MLGLGGTTKHYGLACSGNHDIWWCGLIFFGARVGDPGDVAEGNISASNEDPLWDSWFSGLCFSQARFDHLDGIRENVINQRPGGKKKDKGQTGKILSMVDKGLIVLIYKELLLINKIKLNVVKEK